MTYFIIVFPGFRGSKALTQELEQPFPDYTQRTLSVSEATISYAT